MKFNDLYALLMIWSMKNNKFFSILIFLPKSLLKTCGSKI